MITFGAEKTRKWLACEQLLRVQTSRIAPKNVDLAFQIYLLKGKGLPSPYSRRWTWKAETAQELPENFLPVCPKKTSSPQTGVTLQCPSFVNRQRHTRKIPRIRPPFDAKKLMPKKGGGLMRDFWYHWYQYCKKSWVKSRNKKVKHKRRVGLVKESLKLS